MNLKIISAWLGLVCVPALNLYSAEMSDAEFARYFDHSKQEEGDWPRHFRIGALVGFNIKADFKVDGTFDVSGSNPGNTGDAGRGQNHFYDDGYVRVDDTGNAGGVTTFWGYDNASQYNAGAQTLTFHSANKYTASGSASVDGDAQVGIDLAYGGHLFRYGSALVGWEFGFGWLPINLQDNQQMNATATRAVHSFNTGGTPLPDAPYHDSGIPGIDGRPTIQDRPTLVNAAEPAPGGAIVSGHRELDVTLYNFRLGPTLHWELGRKWAAALSTGGAMGIISGDLKHDEIILFSDSSSALNKGRVSDTKAVYGWYVGGTLMYHADDRGDLFIGAQYMPMGRATFSGAGRKAELDMSGGLFLSAGINWPF